MKNTGIVIASLLGGIVVGSALAMLFAPKSGSETRGEIKDFLDEELDKMKGTVSELGRKFKETHCNCQQSEEA